MVRALALALLLPLCACESKPKANAKGASAPVPATSLAVTTDAGASVDAASAAPQHPADSVAWAFDCTDTTSTPKSGKSIGHTSVVFKIELSSGKKAAWKPNARKVKDRYKGEIAAYRLATALGLPNVPPACGRSFDAATAKAALTQGDAAKVFGDEAIVEHGDVRGVVIPWIEGLGFWPLEKDPLRSEMHGWLSGGEIPASKVELARQASILVAFDFITGNWDRYSGENVGIDASGTHVLFIDNDAAFMQGPPADELAKNKARLSAVARFSRSFIGSVRGIDANRLAAMIGDEDATDSPVLSLAVLTSVAQRIRELVAIVDAKIAARGESETLYFR